MITPLLMAPCAIALLCLLPAATAGAATLTVQVLGADGKPLPDAVVYLDSASARAAVKPDVAAEIIQAGRQFTPRVTVVPVGTPVSFPNRDTVRHHVYSFSPIKTFELKLYAGTPSEPVVFDKPGVAVLGCNIHDQMAAWVLVVQTPHHARTGPDGTARLAHVPDGVYTLRTWHDSLPPESPPLSQAQTVAGLDARVSVNLGGPGR